MTNPEMSDTLHMMVSVDLDKPSRLCILKTWSNARAMFPGTRIRGRISSSGEGVHIVIDLQEPIPYTAMINARRELSDDHKRIHYDETRPDSKPCQILFDTKNGKRAGEWTTDIEHLQRMYRP